MFLLRNDCPAYQLQMVAYLWQLQRNGSDGVTMSELVVYVNEAADSLFEAANVAFTPRHPEVILRQWKELSLVEIIEDTQKLVVTPQGKNLLAKLLRDHLLPTHQAA